MDGKKRIGNYAGMGCLLGVVPGCFFFVSIANLIFGGLDESSILGLSMVAVVVCPLIGTVLGYILGVYATTAESGQKADSTEPSPPPESQDKPSTPEP
jgi:hypothetical protein